MEKLLMLCSIVLESMGNTYLFNRYKTNDYYIVATYILYLGNYIIISVPKIEHIIVQNDNEHLMYRLSFCNKFFGYLDSTPVWTTDAFFSDNSFEEYYSLNNNKALSKRLNSEFTSKYSIMMHIVSPEIIQSHWADYLFFLFKNGTRIDITFNKIIYLLFQVSARPPNSFFE